MLLISEHWLLLFIFPPTHRLCSYYLGIRCAILEGFPQGGASFLLLLMMGHCLRPLTERIFAVAWFILVALNYAQDYSFKATAAECAQHSESFFSSPVWKPYVLMRFIFKVLIVYYPVIVLKQTILNHSCVLAQGTNVKGFLFTSILFGNFIQCTPITLTS